MIFCDVLTQAEHTALLVDSSVCVIPERPGAPVAFLPSKLLKILSLGKPVITNCDPKSALFEAVRQGQFGETAYAGNACAMAEAIVDLALDSDKAKRLGEAGRRYVAQFEKTTVLSDFLQSLRGVAYKKANDEKGGGGQLILVTGGAGYIGSHFLKTYLKAKPGEKVVVIDDLSVGHRQALNFTDDIVFYEADVGNKGLVKEILKKHDIKAVIHFAGSCYVHESQILKAKYFHNNVNNSLALFDAIQECGVDSIVFSCPVVPLMVIRNMFHSMRSIRKTRLVFMALPN